MGYSKFVNLNFIIILSKKIETRICTLLQLVLSRTGGQLKLPPGLGVIQSELSAFTSKLYAIVIHNWNTFGTFYTEILNNYAKERN